MSDLNVDEIRNAAASGAPDFPISLTLNGGQTVFRSDFGVYNPTITNPINCSSPSADQCNYLRVGNIVFVSGKCLLTIDTTAVDISIDISLPISSANFTNDEQANGAANLNKSGGGGGSEGGWMLSVNGDQKIRLYNELTGIATGGTSWFAFSGSYEIQF